MEMETKQVFPGERLCSEEEYVASDGTFTDSGFIYAAVGGTSYIQSGKIGVRSGTQQLKKIQNHNFVVGQVVGELPNVLFIKLDKTHVDHTVYVPLKDGKLVIRQRAGRPGMHRRFGQHDDEEHAPPKPCGINDVILAEVIDDVGDTYELGVRDNEMGVVYSICEDCGTALVAHREGTLFCNSCKRRYHKKISPMYGNKSAIDTFIAAHQ